MDVEAVACSFVVQGTLGIQRMMSAIEDIGWRPTSINQKLHRDTPYKWNYSYVRGADLLLVRIVGNNQLDIMLIINGAL